MIGGVGRTIRIEEWFRRGLGGDLRLGAEDELGFKAG